MRRLITALALTVQNPCKLVSDQGLRAGRFTGNSRDLRSQADLSPRRQAPPPDREVVPSAETVAELQTALRAARVRDSLVGIATGPRAEALGRWF